MDTDNVINFRPRPAIFSQPLRQKLEVGIQGYTEKPQETITAIEHVICTYMVMVVRALASQLGEKLGQKIISKVSNQ